MNVMQCGIALHTPGCFYGISILSFQVGYALCYTCRCHTTKFVIQQNQGEGGKGIASKFGY